MGEMETLLSEKLGESMEEAVECKISEFGGLLTREAAVRLLCRQNGISIEREVRLADAPSASQPFSFRANIVKVYPAQTYSGGANKSLRVHLKDGDAEATLVLWNEHAEFAEREVFAGDELLVGGAYFRLGEVQLGKSGRLSVASRKAPPSLSGITHGLCDVEGVVSEVEPDYYFLDRKDGRERCLSSFLLCDSGGERRRAVFWERLEGFFPARGDELRLEGVVFKGGELHFGRQSRLIVKKSLSEKSGVLRGIRMEGEAVVFSLGDGEFRLGAVPALGLLGITAVPQGVLPSTLLLIKATQICGKPVKYGIGSDGKLLWIQPSG